MIVMEERPELKVRSGREVELRVERTDIRFHDLPGDRVRIEVTVHNDGEQRSAPTFVRLESAPFGAFVPWRPLARLLVPELEPGESYDLSTEVGRPRPASLGDFDRVPPRKLLIALNLPDQPSPGGNPLSAWLNLMRRAQTNRPTDADVSLAPDLWDLLGRGQPHWAGNINVFVGNRAVERHMARALRVYPGRTNLAMFVVGSPGRQDGFSFELVGLSPDWKAVLYDVTNATTLVSDPPNVHIEETQWVESNGSLLVMLATQPPADCSTGNLEVHVTRRGREQTAVVEFSLDAEAQGTGCYTL